MIVDVHAHYFPQTYLDFLDRVGLTNTTATQRPEPRFAPPAAPRRQSGLGDENLEGRLDCMRSAGVGRQILSTSIAPYLDNESDALEGARLINDAYAALARSHPQQFSFWTTLPLPHVEASLEELRRGFDELGAVGVTLQCFCQNETVVRDAFEPIFAEIDRREGVIFFHPCQNAICSHLVSEWGLTVCAGASMEDAVVAMHLIVKQVPRRYPKIRFIVPHFGGILPMLLNRLDGQMPQPDFAERPSVTARRFFYDTVGWGSEAALMAAYHAFGDEQLVPGSDWPFLLGWESYAQSFDHIRNSALPIESIERILYHNAQQLIAPWGRSHV